MRYKIGISLFFLVVANIVIWAFNNIMVNFTETKLWQHHPEDLLIFTAKTYFLINVIYFLSYLLVAFWSLAWLYRKIRNKEIISLLKKVADFCISKQTVVLALILQVMFFMFIIPALIPFLPTELFLTASLVVVALTILSYYCRLKKSR